MSWIVLIALETIQLLFVQMSLNNPGEVEGDRSGIPPTVFRPGGSSDNPVAERVEL